jgi:hypothetical protein
LWRFVVGKKSKFKSEAFEAIHRSAPTLLKIGAIDEAMRGFDMCCGAVPGDIGPSRAKASAARAIGAKGGRPGKAVVG